MYDVIALGELLVDLAERTKDENGYPTLAANPGGAPGNFLAALSAYGKKTAFLAKVGDDTFGHLLTGTMRRAGIDTRGILISPDTFTTLAFVTFDAHGDRSFAFARKPGADTQLRWEEIDPAMLEQARVFHFGSLSCTDEPARTATQKAAAYARAHGKLVTYDPNYRAPLWKTEQEAKAQILWGLSQADIVKISDEETQFLWGILPVHTKHGLASLSIIRITFQRNIDRSTRIDDALVEDGNLTRIVIYRIVSTLCQGNTTCGYYDRPLWNVIGIQGNDIS